MSEDTRSKGIRCPRCQCRHCPAQKTTHPNDSTRRFRQCRNCHKLFKTIETLEAIDATPKQQ